MRLCSLVVAVGLLAAPAFPDADPPSAAIVQGQFSRTEMPFVLKAFRIGLLADRTNRFFSVGGVDVRRDAILLFTFSEPIDWRTVTDQTIQVGVLTEDSATAQANGSLYRHVTLKRDESDPLGGTYTVDRVYRNRVLFDPTSRYSPILGQNPYGFDPDAAFTVTVPGTDEGARDTVRTHDGRRIARTFRATFRTGPEITPDYVMPWVESVEATDAPGVPLEGRTGVARDAGIVVRFSEPMIPESFIRNVTFYALDLMVYRRVRVSVEASPDLMTFTFRPRHRRFPTQRTFGFVLTRDLVDRSGRGLSDSEGSYLPFDSGITFETGPGP